MTVAELIEYERIALNMIKGNIKQYEHKNIIIYYDTSSEMFISKRENKIKLAAKINNINDAGQAFSKLIKVLEKE